MHLSDLGSAENVQSPPEKGPVKSSGSIAFAEAPTVPLVVAVSENVVAFVAEGIGVGATVVFPAVSKVEVGSTAAATDTLSETVADPVPVCTAAKGKVAVTVLFPSIIQLAFAIPGAISGSGLRAIRGRGWARGIGIAWGNGIASIG
jgi:hypothetical protein